MDRERTFPVACWQASVTGAVPPPHRLRGRLRWAWACVKPWTLPASLTLAQRPAGGCRSDRVAHSSPWRMSLQHRPYNLVAMPARSGGISRGLPPQNVVRIAPLHDAGITVEPKQNAEIFTLWAKILSCMPRSFAPVIVRLTKVRERIVRTRFVLLCQGLPQEWIAAPPRSLCR